jgi:hypothetical protein
MTRFCASCGTEVDDTAIFCPTCGQPIDQQVESAIPPAPAWPDPGEAAPASSGPAAGVGAPPGPPPDEPAPMWGSQPEARQASWDEPVAPAPAARQPEPIRPISERRYEPEPTAPDPTPPSPGDGGGWDQREPPTRPLDEPPPMPASADPALAAPRGADRPADTPQPASPLSSVPVTAPVTLSGWLIGAGAAIAAIGALIALLDGGGRVIVDLLVLLAMGAVAISVFFASRMPPLSHLRLATLALVLVAFGAATDRILAGVGGVGELLLFLGAAAAVIGALLLELGRDQPLGGGA